MGETVLNWLLPRFVLAALVIAFGTFIGLMIQHASGLPWLAEAVGVGTAVGLLVLVDAVRGHRLLKWLSGAQADSAPRDTGLGGELGYRMERAVRERDRTIESERVQLEKF